MTAALDLQPDVFLHEHWGIRPLLTRVIGGFDNPLSPEELAGLAMDEAVESRLVRGSGKDMQLEHGPFAESGFRGEAPWTLLVQSVDHHVPAVAALRRLVDFLPGWLLDDIMVSYATDGGGVGPHFDNYDVFLVQGMGQRCWRLGQHCGEGEQQADANGLRVLEDFRQSEEYLLEPGDVLYVPPRLAHWGVAAGPCMTYSIGFRAPRMNDMLSRWTDEVLPGIDPECLFRGGQAAGAPGELTADSLAAAESRLRQLLATLSAGTDWFGELVTEASDTLAAPSTAALPGTVELNPAARLAWWESSGTITIYANGERLPQPTDNRVPLETLCRGEPLHVNPSNRELLETLWQRGCLLDA